MRSTPIQSRLLPTVCSRDSQHQCPSARSLLGLLFMLLFLLLLSLAGLPRVLGPLAGWLSPIAVRVRAVRVRLGGLLALVLLFLLLLLRNKAEQSLTHGKTITCAHRAMCRHESLKSCDRAEPVLTQDNACSLCPGWPGRKHLWEPPAAAGTARQGWGSQNANPNLSTAGSSHKESALQSDSASRVRASSII